MSKIFVLVGVCMLVSACGMSSGTSQYASWDTMYYYDPYNTAAVAE